MFTILQNTGFFLIRAVFDIYIFVLILRLLLQLLRADYYNPLSQFVIKFTFPVIYPLQKILPTLARFDFAVAAAIVIFQLLKLWLLCAVKGLMLPHFLGLLLWSMGDLSQQVVNLFFYAILFQVILSWVNSPGPYALAGLVNQLTTPLLRPIRRVIPPLGGLDLSPVPVMILLKLLEISVCFPLIYYGRALV